MRNISGAVCQKILANFIFVIGWNAAIFGQGNCLIYPEGSGERRACELSYLAIEYPQGSKESQALFDQAIEVGPKYAWAYYQKSVPFFKRGMFADGVTLINRAIALEPRNYLYYRAYWYFYNLSYDHAIRDLEALYTTHKSGYTTTPSGELEMRLILAMALGQTGRASEGIAWIEDLMERYREQPYLKGLYDHHCLGILYLENDQLDLAEVEFQEQLKVNDRFADTYYYLGLLKEKQRQPEEAKKYFRRAMSMFNGEEEGYSVNFFLAYNVHEDDVVRQLEG